MIERSNYKKVIKSLSRGVIVALLGPRQSGKTTLVKQLQDEFSGSTLYLNGDDMADAELLSNRNLESFKFNFKGIDLLIIDEAQRIEDIGLVLKLIYDNKIVSNIVATGSSSFDLSNKINEPLTGRMEVIQMLPLSAVEIKNYRQISNFEYNKQLINQLIIGSYPQVYLSSTKDEAVARLNMLASNYLYKDILELQDIRSVPVLKKLLKLLALQVGSESSLHELATQLSTSSQTIEKYIWLLKESFVIFSLPPYYQNIRKSISKKQKYYFWDSGIRNALINDFTDFDTRQDKGALWENFIISERLKMNSILDHKPESYFIRTLSGSEVDYVELMDGNLTGYEIKLNKNKLKPSKDVKSALNSIEVINRENYFSLIGI